MYNLIQQLFGVYTPITYTDGSGVSVVPSGMAGVDWTFLSGVLLFAITLYCVFRLVGGVLKK